MPNIIDLHTLKCFSGSKLSLCDLVYFSIIINLRGLKYFEKDQI